MVDIIYDIWGCMYEAGYSEDDYKYTTPIINPWIGLHSSIEGTIAAIERYCKEKDIMDSKQFFIDHIKRIEVD